MNYVVSDTEGQMKDVTSSVAVKPIVAALPNLVIIATPAVEFVAVTAEQNVGAIQAL